MKVAKFDTQVKVVLRTIREVVKRHGATFPNNMLDHVVVDANGLITWEIVGSYVIDVNGLV